jgi:hypothetical protein
MPELLGRINFQMRLCFRELLYMVSFRHLSFILMFHFHSMRTREQLSPPTESHMDGRHCHDKVLPGAPKGLLATLLSLPQCNVALGTIPHILASIDQSPVCCPKTLPSLHDKDAKGWILEGQNKV